MRIAFIGIKGLPGTFSGVETHVHELGTRLIDRGHDVTAYVRSHYTPKDVHEDEGIKLIHRPTIPSKHLDASVHSFTSALHAIGRDYDIVHFHCIGPAAFAPLARLSKSRIVTTVHRFDYESGKWGWFAKSCLRMAERVALKSSHGSIAVAPFISAHYAEQGYSVKYIPNGVPLPEGNLGSDGIRPLGLEPNEYYLFLGRLVPEKQPDWSIRAFLESCKTPGRKLVITGGSSATDRYVDTLNELAGSDSDRVQLTGPIYGQQKEELMANCRAFLLPSRLEGLPITLLEAMSHSRPCLVGDIPPHLDVITEGKNGFLHDHKDLASLCDRFATLDTMSDSDLLDVGRQARFTVERNYDWEDVIDSVEEMYASVVK
jgi:glycosyltransferase involved in cell wall biosynthesis